MKKILLTLSALALLTAPALANGDTECEELSYGVWSCPLPSRPAGPPTCHVYGDKLVCNAPVVVPALPEKTKPTNCGWSKAGKYFCW